MSARIWKEKRLALSYASYFACISSNTREDLSKSYPGIEHSRTMITYCGVDAEVFNSLARQKVGALRSKYDLKENWFLFVGSRVQNKGYKNARLFFEAIKSMASGCPVITTRYGSLREVAGDAALIISGHDCRELIDAMDRIRNPAIRQPLIEAGYAQAAKFRWDDAAEQLKRLLRLADAERCDEKAIAFHRH